MFVVEEGGRVRPVVEGCKGLGLLQRDRRYTEEPRRQGISRIRDIIEKTKFTNLTKNKRYNPGLTKYSVCSRNSRTQLVELNL